MIENPFQIPAAEPAEQPTYRPTKIALPGLCLGICGVFFAILGFWNPIALIIGAGSPLLLAGAIWKGKRWSWFFSVFYGQFVGLLSLILGLTEEAWFWVPFLAAILLLINLFRNEVMDYLKVRTDIKGLYTIIIPFAGMLGLMCLGALIYLIFFFATALQG